VPFAFFEKDGEVEGFWVLGFAPPLKVFMAFEETGERVRAGASMPTEGLIDVRSKVCISCQS
jgi:hypothetical protein